MLLGRGFITAFSLFKLTTSKEVPPVNTKVLGIVTPAQSNLCKNYTNIVLPDNSYSQSEVQKNIGYKNNKVGLYVYSVHDFIIKAAEAVNNNGGDWGYVLIPYNIEDYDNNKWNKIFTLLREQRLIPIIQLWGETKEYSAVEDRIKDSAEFLNSLNWPIKNRYISVFNEMNDKNFWGRGIDPSGYAKILDLTIKEYKGQSKDFFILNGAFNASARTGLNHLSADEYMIKMDKKVPGIFKKLDGWASHPYPHINGYRGVPTDTGRDSIKAYEWELEILNREFGVKDLPVFITETGWPHAEGKQIDTSHYPDETAAKYLKLAFENVWLPDERVVAVTPFTIKYDPPFDHFSFIKQNGEEYKIFKALKDLKKVEGKPPLNKIYDPLEEYCRKILEDKNN